MEKRNFKIVVIGGGGVGKSAITIRYMQEVFVDEYDPTIEDTAGQEEYSAMRDQYMRGGEGFLLVFDVSSKVSFNELQAFLNQVWQVKDSKEVPILIVGNKVDLQQRAVSVEDATSFAKSHSLEYMDVSAKTNYNVTEAFSAVVRKIHVQHCKTNPQRKKSRAKCALM